MYLNRAKNFIITFFVILAVYQTAGLWFEGFSSHNFFYTIFAGNKQASMQGEVRFTLKNIIVNQGNNKFLAVYNDIYDSDYKPVFDKAVKLGIKKGNYIENSVIDWKQVLQNKCFIYQYNFKLNGNDVKKLFNVNSRYLDKIEKFDSIIIIPSANVPESLKIIFADSDSAKTCHFELKKNDIISEANSYFTYFEQSDNLFYISSIQSGFKLFGKNIFIPRWTDDGYSYNTVRKINLLEEDGGGVLLNSLDKIADAFFDNPAAKWTSTVNGVYTYSDENTVVKYFTNGVLEYSNYKSGDSASEFDFYDDYMTAVDFLINDRNIENEYYLSGYSVDENEAVYRFDYKINNMPIEFTDALIAQTSMASAIEVTVSGQRVTKYRRYMYKFEINDDEQKFADVDFLDAIDYILTVKQDGAEYNETDLINNINMAYAAGIDDESIGIKWFIDLNGIEYTVPSNKN